MAVDAPTDVEAGTVEPPQSPRKLVTTRQFLCPSCGASLHVTIGTNTPRLTCAHCTTEVPIHAEVDSVNEQDFEALLHQPRKPLTRMRSVRVVCKSCGAETTSRSLSGKCPFCAVPRVIVDTDPQDRVVPQAVLPFAATDADARAIMKKWIKSCWFAPRAFKGLTAHGALTGLFLPFFTFDSFTTSQYSGMRGDAYYETVTRIVFDGDGQPTTRTEVERRMRWTPVSGKISHFFDDVLVGATSKLPDKHLSRIIGKEGQGGPAEAVFGRGAPRSLCVS